MIAPEIVPLTERLGALGLHVTVETAGTVFQPVFCDLMSISPKLANSVPDGRWAGQHDRLRIQPDVLRQLIDRYFYQLKFVVQSPQDLEEIRAFMEALHPLRERVVLMPEGIDPEGLRERSHWLAEICKDEGFRFSPRLHIELWGNQRSV